MAIQNIILFVCFLGVALIAVIAVYSNRKKTQSLRHQAKEPTFNENSYENKNNYSSTNNFSQDEEDDIVDPIVDGNFQAEKYSTHNDYTTKFNNLPKTNAALAALEKKNIEISTAEKEIPYSEEVDSTEILRAEKFFPNDLISLMLMASPEKPFVGYELLQALLSAGLRFGKMNIFHRFEQFNVKGGIMFSLASAIKPGIFEMAKMGAFSSSALVLFMRLSVQKDSLAAFDMMLQTARQLIEDLGGEICDMQRENLSEEKIAEIRAIITEYEKTKGTSELFA